MNGIIVEGLWNSCSK